MKIFAFLEPDWDEAADGSGETTVYHVWTEDQVLDLYYPWWSSEMSRIGKSDQISPEACLDDFVVVHWAWRVDKHEH
jgi:hypothetical protein